MRRILTASDIVLYYDECENGDVEPRSFVCPFCGGEYELNKFEIEHIENEKNLINTDSFLITCPNSKCNSSLILTCISKVHIDEEEGSIIGRSNIADYMTVIEAPNTDELIPNYLKHVFINAYNVVVSSPESAGVYVRKCLELFIKNTWPSIDSAKTNGKKPRSLNLCEKLNKTFAEGFIEKQELENLQKIRNIFNSTAHAGTSSSSMTAEQVLGGLTILMKIIRKYTKCEYVSNDDCKVLDCMNNKYGMKK